MDGSLSVSYAISVTGPYDVGYWPDNNWYYYPIPSVDGRTLYSNWILPSAITIGTELCDGTVNFWRIPNASPQVYGAGIFCKVTSIVPSQPAAFEANSTYALITTTITTYSITAQQYTLSLSNLKSKIEPSGTAAGDINSFSGATVLVVNTQAGQPYVRAKVRIKAGVTAQTGGHIHDVRRPKGTLSSLSNCVEDGVVDTIVCTTRADGYADFTFFAPAPSVRLVVALKN